MEQEELVMQLSQMVQIMAPQVEQAEHLKALWTPDGFGVLSDLFIQQLQGIPGALDHFLLSFSPLMKAAVAPIDAAQQQAMQQQMLHQQAMQQQAQQYPQSMQPLNQGTQPATGEFVWGDGRPAFPDMPDPSTRQGVPHVDLENLNPATAWQTIDEVSRHGGFRGTTLASA
ncbi:MAG: hypothetical protein ACRCT2_01745 [Plesiomonas shigelloides]